MLALLLGGREVKFKLFAGEKIPFVEEKSIQLFFFILFFLT